MTDKDLSEKVREIAEKMHRHANHNNVRGTEEEYVRLFADQLEALLPTPPRPTLADMTPEERAACQWMQADVVNRRVRYVIANPFDEDDEIALIDHDGDICWLSPEYVTPRPDLPPLPWPGDKKPAPALPEGWRLADHKDNGRVIVTTPNDDGRVYYVLPSDFDGLGFDWFFCDHSELTYIDQEADQ